MPCPTLCLSRLSTRPCTLPGVTAAALLLWPGTPVFASETPTIELKPTSVTATRQPQAVEAVPSTVSVTDAEQLSRDNVSTIKDLVRYEPGVSVGGSGQRSGISGYNIRGIDGDRVLTQVDGVEVPNSFFSGPFAHTSRNYVDPEIVKRVEILRGPASVLYGSNAIGGAVSYFTLDPDDIIQPGQQAGARLKTGYSSQDTSWLNSGTVAGSHGEVDGLLHLSQRNGRQTESYGETGGTGLGRTAANPEQRRTTNVLAKTGWNYAEDARLALTYERYRDDRDSNQKSSVGGPFGGGRGANIYRSREAWDTVDRERLGLSHDVALNRALADHLKWSLNYQVAKTDQHTEGHDVTPRYKDVLRVRDTLYEERQWVLDAQLDKAFALGATQHLLTYGATLKRQQVTGERSGYGICLQAMGACRTVGAPSPTDLLPRQSDFPDPTIYTASLFAQDQVSVNQWTWLPGVRYDYTRMAPRITDEFLQTVDPERRYAVRDDAQTWHRLTPRLGVTYAFDEHYTGYGQYSQGFRTPTAKMLYGRFENSAEGYMVEPNPDLKPERSQSFETGLRGHFAPGHFDLAVFYNQYRDFINEDAIGAGADKVTIQANNVRSATIYGAEFKGRLQLDVLGAPAGLYSLGSLAYAHGRNNDNGQPINSVNPLTAVLGAGYEQQRYGAQLNWTLVQKKQRIDDTTFFAPDGTSQQFQTPGYGILDLTGFYKISDDITLNAGLYNLTDKKHWQWDNVRGYDGIGEAGVLAPANLDRLTQPGRNFSINVVWNI